MDVEKNKKDERREENGMEQKNENEKEKERI